MRQDQAQVRVLLLQILAKVTLPLRLILMLFQRLGPTLAGSGAALEVVIPEEGSGASFLTSGNIGKIKRLKNNGFGYGYSHDYTLRPEICSYSNSLILRS